MKEDDTFGLFNQDYDLNKIAIVDPDGAHSYLDLILRSDQLCIALLQGKEDLQEATVAFMVRPGFNYVVTLWAIWKAGAIAVPLCLQHPTDALEYTMTDARTELVIAQKEFRSILEPAMGSNSELWYLENIQTKETPETLVELPLERKAMLLYTSGTTSKPKGVVISFKNITAQVRSMLDAWGWTKNDFILNVLPLHHVHGIVNITLCALWKGATVQFLKKFSANKVVQAFLNGQINLFMAVPTVYYKLINYYEGLPLADQQDITACFRKFRLMVSGSAALPVSVMKKWEQISGHVLLERYGMTEIGMGLSNPYEGERRPGHVGNPLPGVEVRLVSDGKVVTGENEPGEIQIRGDTVFSQYWHNPSATEEAFDGDWFKSGDIAMINQGSYKILGRDSVDIIKSGGYKISALEIEDILLAHPDISECAVVGQPDEEWGEIVTVYLVSLARVNEDKLTEWMKKKLPAYKLPRVYKQVDTLPRNALGKVTKNKLIEPIT